MLDGQIDVCLSHVLVPPGTKVKWPVGVAMTSFAAAQCAVAKRQSEEPWRCISLWRNMRRKACRRLWMVMLERETGAGLEEALVRW